MTARSRKSKSRNTRRPSSAPRSSRPFQAELEAPAQDHADHTPLTEEHSEIVLREARTTRPGTGDDQSEAPPTQRGVGITLHDKSLRPSVLRWKSWEVSDSFREYAERAARGERLPRFEGSILADPSRMLPMPSPDQSETARRRAYGIKSPRPSWMHPDSLVWNPWLWAASAMVFALGLFSFTLWYTTPREEIVWETNALTPAPIVPRLSTRTEPSPHPSVVPSDDVTEASAAEVTSSARVIEPAAALAAPTARVAATPPVAPRAAIKPAVIAPPLAAATPSAVKTEPAPTAVAPLAKAAPVDRSQAPMDGFLKGIEPGLVAAQPSGSTVATYPVPTEPVPAASPTTTVAPAASAVKEADPLLVEAPSF